MEIDCVLDVGANTGGYASFLRHVVGYTGLIISFEPLKSTAHKLRRAASADTNGVVHDFALGSEPARKEIFVTQDSSMCSFLEPDGRVKTFGDHNDVVDRQLVEIQSLDNVMPLLRGQRRFSKIYLKMDTQGFDLQVIKGATNTLPTIRALQSEVSIIPIYHQMPGFFDVQKELAERGFDITGMFPVTRDANLRVIEFDCITINRRYCA